MWAWIWILDLLNWFSFWTDGKNPWQCEKRINQFPLKFVAMVLNMRTHDDLLYLRVHIKSENVSHFVNSPRVSFLFNLRLMDANRSKCLHWQINVFCWLWKVKFKRHWFTDEKVTDIPITIFDEKKINC